MAEELYCYSPFLKWLGLYLQPDSASGSLGVEVLIWPPLRSSFFCSLLSTHQAKAPYLSPTLLKFSHFPIVVCLHFDFD